MFAKSRILLVGLVSSLALIACGSNDAVPVAGTAKNAVAVVNGEPVSERILDMMLKERANMGRQTDVEVRKAYIDRLATQLVIAQEAVKKGLDKSPEVIDQLELMRQSVLIDAFIKDYVENLKISDDMVKAEYEKMKSQEGGTEYRARHILVKTEAEAKSIIAKLNKNPNAFDALAKQESMDTGSKDKGGELGWFEPKLMVPEFGTAVTKLAKGKFSEAPVKTQFGYHVILLEDTREKQFQPLEQMKADLTRKLQQDLLRKRFDELRAKAKIEVMQARAEAAEDKGAAHPK